MRLATYNIEWFDALFDDNGLLINDSSWSRRYDVTKRQQILALGAVFKAIDADAIMIIEAPDANKRRSSTMALENFASHFSLKSNKAIVGFQNSTQQEIALLFDPTFMSVKHDPKGEQTGKKGSGGAPRFDGVFRWDLDTDRTPDSVRFSKPPLEVFVRLKSGKEIRLIGVHIKSKAPHGARGKQEVIRISIENRRKQLAQSIWLRNRVDYHLGVGDSVVVLGDFNDGPGLDNYEKLFGRSSIEIVLGDEGGPCLFDPNATLVLSKKNGANPTSSRFYLPAQKRYLQALLDYIMVSSDIKATNPVWRIWHPFDDTEISRDKSLSQSLLTASDHFPVTIDIDI